MKKNKTSQLTVTNQMNLLYLITGASWILAGIFSLFDNLPCTILKCIALICSIISLVKVVVSEKEMLDEMAEQNLNAAKARTLTYMRIILCLAFIILKLLSINDMFDQIEWGAILLPSFFIYLGIENLLTGTFFKFFEEE